MSSSSSLFTKHRRGAGSNDDGREAKRQKVLAVFKQQCEEARKKVKEDSQALHETEAAIAVLEEADKRPDLYITREKQYNAWYLHDFNYQIA